MSSFLTALVRRVRAEKWPLLLILTSWRTEWRSTQAEGKLPGSLTELAQGDIVHELGRAQGLEAVIQAAFPGLTLEQVTALAEKAEGNPRILDEMLLFLSRRTKNFVGRDQRAALTPAGLANTLCNEFADFIEDRLHDFPLNVRRALSLASL